MNEQMELIQTAKSHVAQIAKVSKEVGKDSDVEKVVCYFGENGGFFIKRKEKGWTIPGEIILPPNATKKQIAERLEALGKTQLEETQIAPIGNGEAEIEYHCAICGEPAGHQVVANGQAEGEQMGQIHQDCTPDPGEECENCGAVFA